MRELIVLSLMVWVCAYGEPLRVFVSIGPQLECVERIGGDDVLVDSMLPPGSSPETFSPGPCKLSALGRADVFFRIGVPFEVVLMHKIGRTFPDLQVIDGTRGMAIRMMEENEGAELHLTEEHANHVHHGPDPHVWLSIGNMQVFALTVRDTLCALLPHRSQVFNHRYENYLRELKVLDRELALSLSRYKGREVVVFHPAFGYFLNRYGLIQRSVELGGKEPGGRHLGQLMRHAKRDGVRNIFVQPQFNRKASEVIAREIGGRVLVLNPLPSRYSKGMLELCRQLVKGFNAD